MLPAVDSHAERHPWSTGQIQRGIGHKTGGDASIIHPAVRTKIQRTEHAACAAGDRAASGNRRVNLKGLGGDGAARQRDKQTDHRRNAV